MQTENISHELLTNCSILEKFWSQENTNDVEEYFHNLYLESPGTIEDFQNDEKLSQDGNNNIKQSTGAKYEAARGRKENTQRSSANARERKRMSRINTGYDRLRRVLPGKRKLTKMESLLEAQNYILYLRSLLEE